MSANRLEKIADPLTVAVADRTADDDSPRTRPGFQYRDRNCSTLSKFAFEKLFNLGLPGPRKFAAETHRAARKADNTISRWREQHPAHRAEKPDEEDGHDRLHHS